MPKVHKKKKTARGTKTYRCVAPDCRYDDREIKPGQNYYEWTKYKQPSQYQHAKCGYPRRSQLSDSKMGSVWDAVDGAAIGNCVSVEDIEAALEAVAATAREVASEYEEAGNTSSPSAEACQTISQELDSWADDLEGCHLRTRETRRILTSGSRLSATLHRRSSTSSPS